MERELETGLHRFAPEAIASVREVLAKRYPTLHVVPRRNSFVLRGSFPVQYEQQVLDWYQIEVTFPQCYPAAIPRVFEIGGRIPHHIDRHVFPDSGAACLFVSEDRWCAWPNGSSLEDFLDVPVRNYFLSQTHFDRTGTWPAGWEPRGHGLDGVIEAYADLLGTTDKDTAIRFMWVMSHEEVKGHWLCPCGSAKRIRDCCRERIRDLQLKIPPELVRLRLEGDAKLRDRAASLGSS